MFNLPLWAAGAAAALFVVLCLLTFSRAGRDGITGGLARIALVFIGASAALFLVDGTSKRDLAHERIALEARALELLARVALPGSPLACLDGGAGDTIEASCEKALFATPETAATAVSYVSAQLALLSDYSDHLRRARTGETATLANLRRAAEADRFGLVAQVLATRDGCTPVECPALALLNDASRVSVNLSERTFDLYVVRYAAGWPAAKAAVAAESAPPGVVTAGRTSGDNLFFPSSASIPPVNIMTSEPPAPEPAPATTSTTAAAPAAKKPPTPPRRPPAAQARPPVDLNAARGAPPAATTQ